jgi:hypothetical protein
MNRKIYISFPSPPNCYKQLTQFPSWSQICYFIYNALQNKFQNVEYRNNTIPLTEKDILITNIPSQLPPPSKAWKGLVPT